MIKDDFQELKNILSPGYEIENPEHFILDYLNNSTFKMIFDFTDQIVCIINHTNLTYSYVSENVMNIVGYSAEVFRTMGVSNFLSKFHPDDVPYLVEGIFPAYTECMNKLDDRARMNVRLSYDYRFLKADNTYTRLLQHNIPLTLVDGKVCQGIALVSDISSYKKENHMGFKMVLFDEKKNRKILAQGTSKEPRYKFTDREIEILEKVAEGLPEKQIAANLSLSLHTIKSHKKNMLQRTGMNNSIELVRYATANQLI